MPAPETMIHPETGALLRRRKRREVVAFMDLTRVVQVTGWFPEDDGDGVEDDDDGDDDDQYGK
jgi:HTH-type transcriptional regulator/antitoxin MqsA